MKGKIVFTGSFGEYFLMCLWLIFMSIITFGILLPYAIWWSYTYFFKNMEIELEPDKKV